MRNPRKIICIDVETTDRDPSTAEILQLSIIDYDGNVLFNHYIKPNYATSWPGAERVNHISPSKVSSEQHLEYYKDELDEIFEEAELIVAYNGDHYDIPIIAKYGFGYLRNKNSYDVMLEFAPIYGAWDDYHRSYTWQKLAVCANYYGYRGEGDFHDSLEDIRATLYCYKKMTDDDENEAILNSDSVLAEKTDDLDGFDDLAESVYEVEQELAEKYCDMASGLMDSLTAQRSISKPKAALFVYGFIVACDALRDKYNGEIPPEVQDALIKAFDGIPHDMTVDFNYYTEPGISEYWYEQSIVNFGNLRIFAEYFDRVKDLVEREIKNGGL